MSRQVAPPIQIGPLLDRQPPFSAEAESAVLGSMLIDPKCIPEVAAVLPVAEAFYTEANQKVFAGLLALGAKHGEADTMLLAQRLRDEGALDHVGGPDYLLQLAEAVPTSANATHYARIVADKHTLRRLIFAAGETIHEAYMERAAVGEDVDALIERAGQRVFDVSASRRRPGTDPERMLELAQAEWADLIKREDNPTPLGIPTRFSGVDDMLLPLAEGDMVILAARPSMGKTSLAMNIAERIAGGEQFFDKHSEQVGDPVAFFSLEMSKKQLIRRFIAARARVPMQRYAAGNLARHEWQLVHEAMRDLQDMPLYIDDTPSITITQLRARARRMVQAHGVKVIFIDYVGLMADPDNRTKSRYEQMGNISRGIKSVAKELRVPIVALAQLNREPTKRGDNRPHMSDLRDTGDLEQDADAVLLLHREAYYHKADPEWDPESGEFNELNRAKLHLAELIIDKQRNGATGVCKLEFIAAETRFRDWRGN